MTWEQCHQSPWGLLRLFVRNELCRAQATVQREGDKTPSDNLTFSDLCFLNLSLSWANFRINLLKFFTLIRLSFGLRSPLFILLDDRWCVAPWLDINACVVCPMPGPARPGGRVLSLSRIRIKLINDDCPLVTATGHCHWSLDTHRSPPQRNEKRGSRPLNI